MTAARKAKPVPFLMPANITHEYVDATFTDPVNNARVKAMLGIKPRTSPVYEASAEYHLQSLPNCRGHWRKEYAITSEHKKLAASLLLRAVKSTLVIRKMAKSSDRIRVHFTRVYAKNRLDDDNNVGAFKFWRDTVAKLFGIDDGNEDRWGFTYGQRKGKYAVEIRVWTEGA